MLVWLRRFAHLRVLFSRGWHAHHAQQSHLISPVKIPQVKRVVLVIASAQGTHLCGKEFDFTHFVMVNSGSLDLISFMKNIRYDCQLYFVVLVVVDPFVGHTISEYLILSLCWSNNLCGPFDCCYLHLKHKIQMWTRFINYQMQNQKNNGGSSSF